MQLPYNLRFLNNSQLEIAIGFLCFTLISIKNNNFSYSSFELYIFISLIFSWHNIILHVSLVPKIASVELCLLPLNVKSWQSFLNIQGHIKNYCWRNLLCVEIEAVLLLFLTWCTAESHCSLYQPFAVTILIPPCWPSMTVPANWDETKRPLSWLFPCFCYFAARSQCSEAPYFIEVLCFKNESLLQSFNVFMIFAGILYFNYPYFISCWNQMGI
jgi:hypothetical protein